MKITKGIILDEVLVNFIVRKSQQEHRSFSGQVVHVLEKWKGELTNEQNRDVQEGTSTASS